MVEPADDADETLREEDHGRAVAKTLRCAVIAGPDEGAALVLDPGSPSRILVGTSPACQLRLTDPTVSRRHVALERAGRRYRLTDLGSTNGTVVNGVHVTEALLAGGETVRCGATLLRMTPTDAEASQVPEATRFGRVIGASVSMRRLYPLCDRLARSRVPVVIEGETGTGKENLAEALHEAHASGPFVVLDCTAVSPSLMEAELFGHERGAFTGAVAERPGVFELAHGGTLLVDEIGDLDLTLQPKLLRAIESGEVRRVGGQRSVRVDVRIIAATRRDLDRAVAAGRFRDDLFHRLAVGRIELPPLRERQGDVELLACHFADGMGAPGALGADLLARLADYHWPGNVRELRNAVARYVALGVVAVADSRRRPVEPAPGLDAILAQRLPFPIARRRALELFERRYVEQVLGEHGGNVAAAAASSGIARRYFQIVRARGIRAGEDPGHKDRG
jgi:DNA-binding NtrC family response regulator